jgi:hypothetical protein
MPIRRGGEEVSNRDGAALVLGGGRGSPGGGGMIPGSSGRFAIMSPDDYIGKGKGRDGGVVIEEQQQHDAAGGAMVAMGGGGGAAWEEAPAERKKWEEVPAERALVPSGDVLLMRSMREWEMRPAEVRLHERLAVGGFAEVFRGTWNGTTVAVKQLLERGPDVALRLREEVVVLARLRHPNLLLFMGWCPEPPLIATEFMRRGSLHNILRRNGGPLGGPRMHHAATSVVGQVHVDSP